MDKKGFIVYVICRAVVNIALIAASVYLYKLTGNIKMLWILVFAMISHLGGLKFTTTHNGE